VRRLTVSKLANNADQYAVCDEITGRTVAVTHDDPDGRNATLFAVAPELQAALRDARATIADVMDNCPYFFPPGGKTDLLTDEQLAWRRKMEDASRKARAVIALLETIR